MRSCTNCALHSGRTKAVPGSGSSAAQILIIGEGPGFYEDQQGVPFVGRSGKLLDELLSNVPLSREDVFITNVVKCRPPDNRDPLPVEVVACRPYLERQIELLNPRVVVTLGRHSMLRFYPEGKISQDHGKILRWEDRILFPLYHPAAGLRNPAIKRDLQADVLKLPEAIQASIRLSVQQPPAGEKSKVQEAPKSDEQEKIKDPVAPPEPPTSGNSAQRSVDSEPQISEPISTNTTENKEEGDRQLGLF